MRIKAYTDGACSGNPGPGGWAAVFVPNKVFDGCELSGYDVDTTNNMMELTAVIEAMKHILTIEKQYRPRADYHIHSDSGYVINAINGRWYKKWSSNGWKTVKGEPVKNRSLWEQFMAVRSDLRSSGLSLTFVKVKGHVGDEYNEMADDLACEARDAAKEALA